MIETVSKHNLIELLPLIQAYQKFYNASAVSDPENKEFFSQFGISSQVGCQFLFRHSGQAIGFASVFFNFSSTLAKKVAVLNDLYVLPDHRGNGVARQLIEHCHTYASKNGCARLQWLTAPDNKPAQRLYDSMQTNKSTWHFYTYNV